MIYWHNAVISNDVIINLCDTFSDQTLVLLVFVNFVLELVMPIEVILLECLIHLEIQFFLETFNVLLQRPTATGSPVPSDITSGVQPLKRVSRFMKSVIIFCRPTT